VVVIIFWQTVLNYLFENDYKGVNEILEVLGSNFDLIAEVIKTCLHDRRILVAKSFLHFDVHLFNGRGVESIELNNDDD
jgi:hypothetical protein